MKTITSFITILSISLGALLLPGASQASKVIHSDVWFDKKTGSVSVLVANKARKSPLVDCAIDSQKVRIKKVSKRYSMCAIVNKRFARKIANKKKVTVFVAYKKRVVAQVIRVRPCKPAYGCTIKRF